MRRHRSHLTQAQMAHDPAADAMEVACSVVAAVMPPTIPFVVLMWVPGKADEPGAVAYGASPDHRAEVPHALLTAATCAKAAAGEH